MSSVDTPVADLSSGPSKSVKSKQKKINKAHPEFELTYDMMLGIRTVVGKTEAQAHNSLTPQDFAATIKLKFPGRGSMTTPAHQMRDFKFKDYSPEVFRMIRDRFNIDPADYLMCVCGNFQYLEFISNSKSGQFFFYTHDRKYMIKTVSQGECKFLRNILPDYYAHIAKNPNTLLTKFYGLHRVRPHKKKQRHFLIMGSVFYTSKYIHKVFDLKGSTQGRSATEEEKKSPACIFKDLDLIEQGVSLTLGEPRAKILNAQIARDVEFLRSLDIMDYSLLLGIHYRDRGGKYVNKLDKQAENDTKMNGIAESPADGIEVNDIELENNEILTSGEGNEEIKSENNKENHPTAEQKTTAEFDQIPSRTTRSYTTLIPNTGGSQFFHRPKSEFHGQTTNEFIHQKSNSIIQKSNGNAQQTSSQPTTPTAAEAKAAIDTINENAPDESVNRSPRVTRSNTVFDIPNFDRSPAGKAAALIKRQSQYGLPKHWNVTSKPSDISFNAPEFEPLVIQTPRPNRVAAGAPELASLVNAEEKSKPISLDKLIVENQLVYDAGGLAGLTSDGQLSNEVYFMGIIDILTIYSMKKRMETIAKAFKYSTAEISSVNPTAYGERFKKFLATAIK